MSRRYHLENIKALLREFTDEELRCLCYDGPGLKPVYDRFTQKTGKAAVIRLLLEYASQETQFDTLLDLVKEPKPHVYAKYQPYYDDISAPTSEPIPPVLATEPAESNDEVSTTTEKIRLSSPLSIFLCHASEDKPAVRKLYHRLRDDGLDPWLDEVDLLPGQVWQQEIPAAIRASDVILVCLSNHATTKEGYIRDEIAYALDIAEQQPKGTIFFIPVRLEECQVPERLRRWQWVNLFEDTGYDRLINALQVRVQSLKKGLPLKGKLLKAFRDPMWQMIGVIIAILALSWSVYTYAGGSIFGSKTPTSGPPSPSEAATPTFTDMPKTHPLLPTGAGEGLDPLRTITDSRVEIRAVAFSPDSTKLASGGKDSLVRIWDTSSGQEIHSLEGHTSTVTTVMWSPNGQRLASGSEDKTIRIWNIITGKQALPPLQGHTDFVFAVAWSPDGERLASGGKDRQVIVWDAESGAIVLSCDIGGDGLSVAWSPDSTRLAVSSVHRVLVLEPHNGKELQRLTGKWGDSWDVAWSPDGQYLAAAGHDNHIHLWQAGHWENERLLKGHTNTVTSVIWSPDGQRLASAAYDGTARVWDAATGTELSPALATPGGGGGILTIDWSRDGKRLAASGEGIIWIWDATFLPIPADTPKDTTAEP